MAMNLVSRSASVFMLISGLAAGVDRPQDSALQLKAQPPCQSGSPTGTTAIVPPTAAEFVIGVNDVLGISIWREPELSVDNIPVLPDGKITLKLVNNVQAAGLTAAQLAESLTKGYSEFLQQKPIITVIVRQVNSRKVCTVGKIARVGCFDMTPNMDVLELVIVAGGLLDFADEKNLILVRKSELRPDGTPWTWQINFKDIKNRRKMEQNRILKPGDTLIVN